MLPLVVTAGPASSRGRYPDGRHSPENMKPSRSDSLRDEHARGKLRVLVVLVGLWRDAHLGARLLRKHVLTPNAASNVSIALITNTDELCSIKDGVRKRISHSLLGVTSWLLI